MEDNQEKSYGPPRASFSLFKSKVAFRLSIETPTEPFKVGSLNVQMAPLKEKRNDVNIYDWETKKVSIKIGVNDILKFIKSFADGSSVELFHKFGDSTKTIKMVPKSGDRRLLLFRNW